MKKIIFFLCFIPYLGMAQADKIGSGFSNLEKSTELKMLYQQSKQLELHGTAAEINANRLAIKQAWETVNPEVAALYKPLPHVESHLNWQPNTNSSKPSEIEDWEAPMLIRAGFADGISMDVDSDDNIYIAGYENAYQGNPDAVNLFVYKSTDGGDTFTKILDYEESSGVELEQIQALTMTGTSGPPYLLIFYVGEIISSGDNGAGIFRYDLTANTSEIIYIGDDIESFAADINFTADTSVQQVFVTYTKENPACSGGKELFSARSTAGSYGSVWVDEFTTTFCVKDDLGFAYGLNGSIYSSFIGGNSGNLYAMVNTNYNDPASWLAEQTIGLGSEYEFDDPSIRAARKEMSEDNVILAVSRGSIGGGGDDAGIIYRRTNGSDFSYFSAIMVTDFDVEEIDTFVRKMGGDSNIGIVFTTEGSSINSGYYMLYDGLGLSDPYVFSGGIDVSGGYPPEIAIMSDDTRIASFAGYGDDDVYFTRNTASMGVDNSILNQISVYPNPVGDFLNIRSEKPVQLVEIFDMSGQKVRSNTRILNGMVNMSSLAPDTYVVKVKTEGEQTKSFKIIKK